MDTSPTQQHLQGTIEGKRKHERHRKRWMDNIKLKDCARLSIEDFLDSTQDRIRWRRVVAEATVRILQRLILSKIAVTILMYIHIYNLKCCFDCECKQMCIKTAELLRIIFCCAEFSSIQECLWGKTRPYITVRVPAITLTCPITTMATVNLTILLNIR